MAQLDSTIPVKWSGSGTLVLTDGSGNTVTAMFEQGTFTWTESARAYVEAMTRGRHTSGGPTLIETDDGTVSGSFTFLITSFYGNAAVTMYEALSCAGPTTRARCRSHSTTRAPMRISPSTQNRRFSNIFSKISTVP